MGQSCFVDKTEVRVAPGSVQAYNEVVYSTDFLLIMPLYLKNHKHLPDCSGTDSINTPSLQEMFSTEKYHRRNVH